MNTIAAVARPRERVSRHVPTHAAFSLTNVLAVFPDRVEPSSVVVRDGLVHRIGAVHAAKGRRIDCGKDYLLPGLIELHTDNLERHIEPRPGTFWNTDRAVLSHDAELAAAGITTAFEGITLGADTSEGMREGAYLDAISSIKRAESLALLRVQHRLHLRCELGSSRLQGYLANALQAWSPALMSLMEHVPGQRQWLKIDRFREHYSRRFGLRPEQIDALIARRTQDRAEFSESNRAHVIDIARDLGCVLASHDDALASDVEEARSAGCTLAEFPTSMEAARTARKLGMRVIAGAPNLIRGGSHSGNVAAAALTAEGLIDILSSDYCPSSLLQGIFALEAAGIPLHAATAAATLTPARAMNLQDRGILAEGKRADMIRVRSTAVGPVVVAAWCAGQQIA